MPCTNQAIMMIVILCYIKLSGGQTCTGSVNIQQNGQNQLGRGALGIVPRLSFTCDGRITGIMARVRRDTNTNRNDYPYFIIWRPSSTNSMVYTSSGEVQLQESQVSQCNSFVTCNVNIVLSGSNRIEFLSGDVVGYYHPQQTIYQVRTIRTNGYERYRIDGSSAPTSVDLSTVNNNRINNNRQPLIQFVIDRRCPNLTTPPNGEITPCSSGSTGVGYEGDTCSFTCNTGYELTSSDTRTCQSDGSWSGSDDVCRRVECPVPNNGTLSCPNGDTTGVFEDACTFLCDVGYELQGPSNGTCLADQSWSEGDPICVELNCSTSPPVDNSQLELPCDTQYWSTCTTVCVDGYTGGGGSYTCVVTDVATNNVGWNGSTNCERVECPAPNNGILSCPNGATTGVFEDTCTFSCDSGYELQGPSSVTCLADQSWSGGDPICVILNCSTSLPVDNSQVELPCDTQYQSTCTTVCVDGYTGGGGSYTCVVTDVGTNTVDWQGTTSCQRVQCPQILMPENGEISCSLINDPSFSYEDTCSFTCNTGYELTGSPQRTCQSDGSWSGSLVSCTIMECPSSSLPMNSMLAVSCRSTYLSMCDLECEEGFNGSGDPSYVCDVLTDGSVMWMTNEGGWSCERVQCTSLSSPSNDQCSFSCDPGYELTGSSTRQCLSNGSWNGADVTCNILHCNNLTNTIENSVLVNDCGSEFGSVCSLGCETGYRPVGNDMFTCDSVNDTVEWTGEALQCDIVTCVDLPMPSDGTISCSSNNQPLQYQDTCTFQCNDGYELEGSVMRQCETSGEWSGTSTQCNILHCPDITTVVANSRPCDTSYTSTCMVECEDGYDMSGNAQYSCDLNGTEVTWTLLNGSDVMCSPVPCNNLTDPENGNVTCPSITSVFQDTCTYYCNRGYQLNGSRQPSCTADGTWSSQPVTCTILTCNDPESEITSSQLVGDCSLTYGSRCLLNCSSGYIARGDGEHVCDVVNDDGTSVRWRSVGEDLVCASSSASSGDSGSPSVAVIGGAVGGFLAVTILVSLVLLIVFYIRRSYKKKTFDIDNVNSTSTDDEKFGASIVLSNEMYESIKQAPEAVYETAEYSFENRNQCSVVNTALSTLKRTLSISYEEPVACNTTENLYEMQTPSPYEMAQSMEAEQQIYETPCEDEEDYGPIYCMPPSDEEKIYVEFEGKRFRKLYRREIESFEELGAGEFGVVTCGMWKPSPSKKTEVAIKSLNVNATEKDRLRFLQEAVIMCQFHHENVIKLYGVVTDAPAMIVLEYMSRGDLREILIKLQPCDGGAPHPQLPIVLLKFCQEIAAGMTYLSGKKFIHRDLAARNVLVSEKTTCKIADFGMSRDILDENYYVTSGGKIPVKWTAPEAMFYRKYSLYSDIWSFACVLYEIWSLGHKPFEDMTAQEMLERLETGYRLPPPPGCPRTIYRIMVKCWNPEPRSRPQFAQITKLLAGSGTYGYLLGWSDEDRQTGGEDAMKLGAPLESTKNLYNDLQHTYG
ncbi:uncharacterized protein [Dysidea avara]|uniref:uncharacterized protein isoform X2 n=1 Tax=Dysidea avara TaxID=196820 RepID=UPI00331EF645